MKEQLRERLREATPKPYRTRAESLYNFLKDKIQFNPKGEIYTNEGVRIEGSNIADLVQHAVRDRQRNINPVGWKTFLTQLKDSNAPQMILNYNTLDELHPSTITTKQQAIANRFGRETTKSVAIKRSRSQSKAKSPAHQTPRRQSIPSTLSSSSYLGSPPTKALRKSSRVKKRPAYLNDYVL